MKRTPHVGKSITGSQLMEEIRKKKQEMAANPPPPRTAEEEAELQDILKELGKDPGFMQFRI
jgi:hypothetical protein